MGAYLSTPRTEKDSMDEKSEDMLCGASSMQGWRINQEDAHNCELNFDKDASFFAVYDGHGGPEIALYCSKHLPAFFKLTEAYKAGDYERALREAFLGFDAKLLGSEVIEELKVLAGDKYGIATDEGEGDEDSDEDLAELKQEGGMPIEAVLTKYKNMMKKNPLSKLMDEEAGGSAGSSSSSGFKPHSPCLRGKKQAAVTQGNGEEKPSGSSTEEAAVSSSSATDKSEAAATAASSSSEKEEKKATASKPMESPDSSSTDANKVGNSDAGVAASSPSKGADVSSSSTNAAEAEAGGSSSTSSSTVNGGESGGISSTNVERAAKRVALSLSQPTAAADSEDSDEDEKDQTYDENNSTDEEEGDDDDEEEDDEMDDEDDDEEEEEEEEEEDGEDDDGFISNMVEEPGKDSGCTAVVAFRHGRDLYVANAGDSRCVLSRGGEVIEMSFDHKPEDTEEFERIKKAGGRVTMDGRVNGGLNLSRAIGDHAYKMNQELPAAEQMISAKPDIKKIELTDADDFMVLACDGIWNFMSSEAVVKFVKLRLDKGETKLSKICEELFDHCLAKDTTGDGTGCDNMTAIIVRFKWNEQEVTDSGAAAVPTLEVGLKRAASSSPLPVPEISEAEADGGLKAKRAKTEVEEETEAPTTTA